MPFTDEELFTPSTLDHIRETPIERAALNISNNRALADKAAGVPEDRSAMQRVLDVIARTNYASAGFAHEFMRGKLFTEPVATITSAFREAGDEFLFARDRRTYADLIEEHAPGFYEKHPVLAQIAGFVGDVALDPLTYATFGTGSSLKVGLKGVSSVDEFSKVGAALKGVSRASARGGIVTASKKGRSLFKNLVKEEAGKAEHLSSALADAKAAMKADVMHRANMGEDAAELFVNRRLWNASEDLENHVPLLNDKYGLKLHKRDFEGMVLPNAQHIEHRAMGRLSDEIKRALLVGDASLVEKGGFKIAGKKVPLVDELADEIIERTGLRKLGKIVKNSKPVSTLRSAFQRFPEEIKEIEPLEKDFHRRLAEGEGRVKEQVFRIFKGVDEVSRVRVGAFMSWLDDVESKMLLDTQRRMQAAAKEVAARTGTAPKKVSHAQVKAEAFAKIDDLIEGYLDNAAKQKDVIQKFAGGEYGDRAIRTLGKRKGAEFVQRGALTPEEVSLIWTVHDEMKNMGRLEMTSKILANTKRWYSPRYYDAIRDVNHLTTRVSRLRAGVAGVFGPNETRDFKTIQEAIDHGFDPIFDAAQLYALRASASYEALARMEFNRALSVMVPEFKGKMVKFGLDKAEVQDDIWDYGNPKIVSAIKQIQQNIKLGMGDRSDAKLAQILEHVRFMGSPMYDPLDTAAKNYVYRAYDKTLSLFRSSATVMRMAFGSRNVVSNQFQMFLGGGLEAIRHLNIFVDPRAGYDAGALLLGMRKPSVLAKLQPLRKHYGGGLYSADELIQLAKEHNIVRNVAFEGVGGNAPLNSLTGVKKMTKILDRERVIKGALRTEKDGLAVDGLTGLLSGGVNFWDFPAFLEDHSRLTMFMNMLKSGYDSPTAARLVDDALFDYTHGMSKFETRIMRRIIPFYSFQRFAAPLITRATVKNPGRVSNTLKTGKTLMRAWGRFQSGEDLTPEERAAIPDWLLSQPHEFAGWEGQFAKFNTFNNYLPLDVFSFVESNNTTGDLDIKETLMRVSLSQLTPLVKVPLEFLVGQDFFTGRDFESMRDAGELDVDRLLGNMAALVTNQASQKLALPAGTFTAPGMRELWGSFASASPDTAKFMLKTMLGYEEGVNRYGERTAYFSPYRIHMATSLFPALNTAIKDARLDKTPLERAYYTLFGVPTAKRRLDRDRVMKRKLRRREIEDKRYEIQLATVRQQDARAQKLRGELNILLDHWKRESDELQGFTPRVVE